MTPMAGAARLPAYLPLRVADQTRLLEYCLNAYEPSSTGDAHDEPADLAGGDHPDFVFRARGADSAGAGVDPQLPADADGAVAAAISHPACVRGRAGDAGFDCGA